MFSNRAEAISYLLASFPASHSDPVTVAKVYLMAIQDQTDIGVFKTAKEYIYGTVPNNDRRFAPSVAEFASRVRMHDQNGEAAVRLMLKRPEKKQEYLSALLSDDDREEMKARFASALDNSLQQKLGYEVGYERED
jgi:hypothetical protein